MHWRRAAAALSLLPTASNAFVTPTYLTTRRGESSVSVAAVAGPLPPVQEATVVVSADAFTSPRLVLEPASLLPSQRELAEKVAALSSSSLSVAAAQSAANVASGAGVVIADINYDGQVPKTESDEYVVISNASQSIVDISKYYVYVATTGTQGPTFYFPNNTLLKPGQSVRIYTNEIHKETGGYSFGSGKALWSNNGGLAVLKDAGGKKVMEFKYKPAK